jgi:hypothetical protein
VTPAHSTLQQTPARTETMSRMNAQRPATRSVNFDLDRSRGSRHRHRVLVSAQHLATLFDGHRDRSPSLH